MTRPTCGRGEPAAGLQRDVVDGVSRLIEIGTGEWAVVEVTRGLRVQHYTEDLYEWARIAASAIAVFVKFVIVSSSAVKAQCSD